MESAVILLNGSRISVFPLSVILSIVQASGRNDTKGLLGSSMATSAGFTGQGARSRDFEDMAWTGTFWSSSMQCSSLVFSRDRASVACCFTLALWTISNSSVDSLSPYCARLPVASVIF